MWSAMWMLVGLALLAGFALGAMVTQYRRRKMMHVIPDDRESLKALTDRVIRVQERTGVTLENRMKVAKSVAEARRTGIRMGGR